MEKAAISLFCLLIKLKYTYSANIQLPREYSKHCDAHLLKHNITFEVKQMLCARTNVNVDTGAHQFYISFAILNTFSPVKPCTPEFVG